MRSDVSDYVLMLGVPARQHGWMSRHGHLLHFDESSIATCPESKLRYELSDGKVRGLDLPEDEPLPEKLSRGGISYRDLKPDQS
jgi:UDP-2-acetamido-3-amino-2,3-dideoxy-glucuronate N-acetyltransferase